jgi:hypothetical protein
MRRAVASAALALVLAASALPAEARPPERFRWSFKGANVFATFSEQTEATCPDGYAESSVEVAAFEESRRENGAPEHRTTAYVAIRHYEFCGYGADGWPIFKVFTDIFGVADDLPAGALQMDGGLNAASLSPISVPGFDALNDVPVTITVGLEATGVGERFPSRTHYQDRFLGHRFHYSASGTTRSADASLFLMLDGAGHPVPALSSGRLGVFSQGIMEIIRY